MYLVRFVSPQKTTCPATFNPPLICQDKSNLLVHYTTSTNYQLFLRDRNGYECCYWESSVIISGDFLSSLCWNWGVQKRAKGIVTWNHYLRNNCWHILLTSEVSELTRNINPSTGGKMDWFMNDDLIIKGNGLNVVHSNSSILSSCHLPSHSFSNDSSKK